MTEAINYALGLWSELSIFSTGGSVPIDHNVSEREMKRVVPNRSKYPPAEPFQLPTTPAVHGWVLTEEIRPQARYFSARPEVQ